MLNSPSPKQQRMRERIAQLAARLMAEDGIQDFGAAKRKAARQLGAPDTHSLPNNSEVELALSSYQALYQSDEQPQALQYLREQALVAMRLLAAFKPYLTGSVLSGTAGIHSNINLELYTDDVKEVEWFLLGKNQTYKISDRRMTLAGQVRSVPVVSLELDDTIVEIAVFSDNDLRNGSKHSEKMNMEKLEALLALPE